MTIVATPIALPGPANPVSAVGDFWSVFLTLTFSGSYVTGGDAFDPTVFFPGGATTTVLLVDVAGGAGTSFEYDKVNKKLKAFSASNTEVTAGAYNAALTGDTNVVCQVFAK
jgi:hypothetical protein